MRAIGPFLRDAWALARPYWSSEDRWRARGLLLAVVALNLSLVGMTVVLTFWLSNSTVTFSPSRAVPQTGTGWPRCRTAPSVNSGLGFTSACSEPQNAVVITSSDKLGMVFGVMGIAPYAGFP